MHNRQTSEVAYLCVIHAYNLYCSPTTQVTLNATAEKRMVSSTPNPIRLQTHSKVAVKAAKAANPCSGQTAVARARARFWVEFYACAKVTMASFKASHPKCHDLTLARTGGERRSLDVRAHLKGPWRCVVKKLMFRLVPVRR